MERLWVFCPPASKVSAFSAQRLAAGFSSESSSQKAVNDLLEKAARGASKRTHGPFQAWFCFSGVFFFFFFKWALLKYLFGFLFCWFLALTDVFRCF